MMRMEFVNCSQFLKPEKQHSIYLDRILKLLGRLTVNNNYVNMQSVSDTARELAHATMSECDITPRITRGPENGNGSQDKIDSHYLCACSS